MRAGGGWIRERRAVRDRNSLLGRDRDERGMECRHRFIDLQFSYQAYLVGSKHSTRAPLAPMRYHAVALACGAPEDTEARSGSSPYFPFPFLSLPRSSLLLSVGALSRCRRCASTAPLCRRRVQKRDSRWRRAPLLLLRSRGSGARAAGASERIPRTALDTSPAALPPSAIGSFCAAGTAPAAP